MLFVGKIPTGTTSVFDLSELKSLRIEFNLVNILCYRLSTLYGDYAYHTVSVSYFK